MTSPKSPGRPRDVAIDSAILLAAWQELNRVGYTALTMTAVAEGAGIQKPALYRRWPTKPLLVIDALATHLPAPTCSDHGSLAADLEHLVSQLAQTWSTSAVRRSFSPLLADIKEDEDLVSAFRERVSAPRVGVLHQTLARAAERGELRPDAPLDVVADLLEGPLMHRATLGSGKELDDRLLDSVLTSCLNLLLAG